MAAKFYDAAGLPAKPWLFNSFADTRLFYDLVKMLAMWFLPCIHAMQ